MTVSMSNELGRVDISNEVIANIAGSAALECYGLVGMASRSQLKDGLSELLGKENLSKGIEVRSDENGIALDLHIIVSYGTKISEVAHNVQTKVHYTLQETLGIEVNAVNIYVQGVRLVNA